jgi:16S rRNA (cytosine1402-N4)-methyltransferase
VLFRSAILDRIGPNGRLIGIDQDIRAIEAAQIKLQRFSQQAFFVNDNFVNLASILRERGISGTDGIVIDLGVSSEQLDNAVRGFSYQEDDALDMRMDQKKQMTAADIIADYSKQDLTKIFREYGEEKWASRIAEFIVIERERKPIKTASDLVSIIKDAIPASARRKGGHPARRVFQALRIEVNAELDSLKKVLDEAAGCLKIGGRLLVISYHSIEDRIVKDRFRELSQGCTCPASVPVCTCGKTVDFKILTKRPITPSVLEVAQNPRSRSAKLRALEKIA